MPIILASPAENRWSIAKPTSGLPGGQGKHTDADGHQPGPGSAPAADVALDRADHCYNVGQQAVPAPGLRRKRRRLDAETVYFLGAWYGLTGSFASKSAGIARALKVSLGTVIRFWRQNRLTSLQWVTDHLKLPFVMQAPGFQCEPLLGSCRPQKQREFSPENN